MLKNMLFVKYTHWCVNALSVNQICHKQDTGYGLYKFDIKLVYWACCETEPAVDWWSDATNKIMRKLLVQRDSNRIKDNLYRC
jgi:hypothetical protein